MKHKRSAPSRCFRPSLETLEDRLAPATLPTGFQASTLGTGIAKPTAMEIAPDGRIFVLEQTGNIKVVYADGGVQAAPVLSLSVDSSGERGLLGIAFDPAFATNQYFYVYYTTSSSGIAHNRVSRFTAQGDGVVPGSEMVLLNLDNLSSSTGHNGGAIHFGKDGKLYIGVGDNSSGANAQSMGTLFGKMLRINTDGSIPTDNPFYATASGKYRAIWALGLRNPYTFAVQPGTGRIFINDVGESSFEEIDEGTAGSNYGWPSDEGFGDDSPYTDPLIAYAHGSGTDKGYAIVGGSFYNPVQSAFPADYVGDYFYADLANNWIRKYDPVHGDNVLFASDINTSTVDLKVDSAGRLYYLSRGNGAATGTVERISYGQLTTQQSFVRGLYQDFLGRAGSMGELNGWASQLPATASWDILGPAAVAVTNGIARSHEALQRVVDSYYSYFLGRTADGTEEQGWVTALQNGATTEQVAAGILASGEFAARANALEGTLDGNTNYVRALYRLLLGRADSFVATTEVQGWTAQFPSRSRDNMALGFLQSFEYRNHTVQIIYGTTQPPALPFTPNLLKRTTPVAISESASWAGFGLDLYSIEVRIASSWEYYS